jgi:hypothetical protein
MTSKHDKERELQAITKYVSLFGGSFQKLGHTDVGYKIFDREGNVIGYVEVINVLRRIHNPYPLPANVSKLVRLMAKRLQPVLVWSCDDGIMYAPLEKISGTIKIKDEELTAYYEKQKPIRYVRFA